MKSRLFCSLLSFISLFGMYVLLFSIIDYLMNGYVSWEYVVIISGVASLIVGCVTYRALKD